MISTSCKPQVNQAVELTNVYSNLAEALKSKDDNILKEFCFKLAPNESTLEFMRENDLCYRGIPCKMDEKRLDISIIGNSFFPNLLEVRDWLSADGLLDSLSHLDTTQYKWEMEFIYST